MDKRCLSVLETAQVMGVCKNTIFTLLRNRSLSCVLVGKRRKIPVKEIDRYMEQNTIPYKVINYRKPAKSA